MFDDDRLREASEIIPNDELAREPMIKVVRMISFVPPSRALLTTEAQLPQKERGGNLGTSTASAIARKQACGHSHIAK